MKRNILLVLSVFIVIALISYICFNVLIKPFAEQLEWKHHAEQKFEKDAVEYLNGKYSEKMLISSISYDFKRDAFIARVYPEENNDLTFEVTYFRKSDRLFDDYLVEYLDQDIQRKVLRRIGEKYKNYVSSVYVDFAEYKVRDKAEEYCKKHQKPASWDDLEGADIDCIGQIHISFDNESPGNDVLYNIILSFSDFEYDFSSLQFYVYKPNEKEFKKKFNTLYLLKKDDVDLIASLGSLEEYDKLKSEKVV